MLEATIVKKIKTMINDGKISEVGAIQFFQTQKQFYLNHHHLHQNHHQLLMLIKQETLMTLIIIKQDLM